MKPVLPVRLVVIQGADFVDSPSPGTDLNGHGTHVAGILGLQ